MLAFVLSGGGNRGALDVGALRVLVERGIRPEMLVGTSAGAVNAAMVASDPTLEGVQRLVNAWREITKYDVYPGNHLTAMLRSLLRQDGMFPNRRLCRFIRAHLPAGVRTFADVQGARLYVTAVELGSGELRIFGDDPADQLLDAIMASTALPPYLPPWRCDGLLYMDGGAAACLPLSAALERGATEVYALDLTYTGCPRASIHGVIPILFQAADIMVHQLRQRDLAEARQQLGAKLHYVSLALDKNLSPFDFRHTGELIEEGRRRMAAYLEAQTCSSSPGGGEVK